MSGGPFPYPQLKYLQMVHELHRMGYQKLRVFPYEGPNFWRCTLLAINNVDFNRNHFPIDEDKAIHYSEAGGYRYLDWEDCERESPFELACRFVREKSEFLRDCQGSDPAYVQWYIELLGFAAAGRLPSFGGRGFDDFSNMGTLLGRDLPNPPVPGGEHSARPDLEAHKNALDLLLAVHELHRRGYQKLRAIGGLAPSGVYYRICLSSRDFMTSSTDTMPEFAEHYLRYSTSEERRYFGRREAFVGTPEDLADWILAENSELMRASEGSDWEYAGWFVEMLWFAKHGSFPIQFADWYETPRFAAEYGGRSLPFPPGPWSE